MNIVTANAYARLMELTKALRGDPASNYIMHFNTSKLQDHYKSEFQLKIAINILNDIFRKESGTILLCNDRDIFLVYHGSNRDLLDKAIFQLRYLFVDDLLANHPDGTENEDFCDIYDLTFEWRTFYNLVTERMGETARAESQPKEEEKKKIEEDDTLRPYHLVEIEDAWKKISIDDAIRKQPIAAVKRSSHEIKPIFQELYVNMLHLQKNLAIEVPLASNRHLFTYITTLLDTKVIKLLSENPEMHTSVPISLNLNISSVLSDRFEILCNMLSPLNAHIVVEIQISDVFADMQAFYEARDIIQRNGHRLCLDGLTNASFVQVDREKLGFDLAKLFWNADFIGDLHSRENKHLAEVIRHCGSNRMILCRCDTEHAIDYGNALGISLFQGRYIDRVLNPDSTVVN